MWRLAFSCASVLLAPQLRSVKDVCCGQFVFLLITECPRRPLLFVFSHVTSKKGKKDAEDSDSDMDDLDDEEVSLGSMDEEDFGDELEEEGGTFMDPDEGGEEDDDESREYQKVVFSMAGTSCRLSKMFPMITKRLGDS